MQALTLTAFCGPDMVGSDLSKTTLYVTGGASVGDDGKVYGSLYFGTNDQHSMYTTVTGLSVHAGADGSTIAVATSVGSLDNQKPCRVTTSVTQKDGATTVSVIMQDNKTASVAMQTGIVPASDNSQVWMEA